MARLSSLLLIVALATGLVAFADPVLGGAEEGWVIRSFDARYIMNADGSVDATEDLRVDFSALERHGIFRDMTVEYAYNDESNRLIDISQVSVTDGNGLVPFELNDDGPNLRIKIGDPDRFVSGELRYVISYTINDGLNPFADHDELYWNVTGNDWAVPVESASAIVTVPGPGIERLACFEGPTGSTAPCSSSGDDTTASFEATSALQPGDGLTIVVGLQKGLVAVGPPVLVAAPKDTIAEVQDLFELNASTIPLTIVAGIVVLAALGRQWWVAGRDRWFGNQYYLNRDSPRAQTKPLLARETIVVEFQPPEVADGRRLRPAEIGLLLDERADTLDVSATIVHLAVRRHLTIKEVPKTGIFGIFKKQDYELVRESDSSEGEPREGRLRPFEDRLVDALFDGGTTVKLSELKNKFHDDLAEVKKDLYYEAVSVLKLFPRDPEKVRTAYRVAGVVIAVAGGLIAYGLGRAFGGGIIGFPVVIGGVLLFALAHMMPRRTAQGRELYRRCLGFRLYMTKAEKERQEFAEKANLFEEYLPYAIVYGCVDKWAKAFEGLGLEGRESSWYVGQHGFSPVVFAGSLGNFSSSLSGVLASTPGGSGGSGFGGGGGSGGGGGGGGGGSW
ncbi:MAG: DUF2207 domain-containing protein [Vicinamibacterales bacterium]